MDTTTPRIIDANVDTYGYRITLGGADGDTVIERDDGDGWQVIHRESRPDGPETEAWCRLLVEQDWAREHPADARH